MATLLTSSGNATGTGASHSGPATVFARGVFDGARVIIQVSDDDTNYVRADTPGVVNDAVFVGPGARNVNALGTYYIRCVVEKGGSSTSITAVSTQ